MLKLVFPVAIVLVSTSAANALPSVRITATVTNGATYADGVESIISSGTLVNLTYAPGINYSPTAPQEGVISFGALSAPMVDYGGRVVQPLNVGNVFNSELNKVFNNIYLTYPPNQFNYQVDSYDRSNTGIGALQYSTNALGDIDFALTVERVQSESEFGSILDGDFNRIDSYSVDVNNTFAGDVFASGITPSALVTLSELDGAKIFNFSGQTGSFIYSDLTSVFGPNSSNYSGIFLYLAVTQIVVGELGASAALPVLPSSNLPSGGFVFSTQVTQGVPVFFDPPVSIGYDYSVAAGSPLIASAMFPTLLGDLDGFDIFEPGEGGALLFSNVMGGQWVDFTSLAGSGSGIQGFALRGINPALQLDPNNPTAFVTGLTFAGSGQVSLTQTPVTIDWPIGGAVPEPSSWAMLIAGFGLVGAILRRRRLLAA